MHPLWKPVWQVLKRSNQVTTWPSNSIPRYLTRDLKAHAHIPKKLYLNVHRSILHNTPNVETTQMFNCWLAKKMQYNHTMDYYSVIQKGTQHWLTLEHGRTLKELLCTVKAARQKRPRTAWFQLYEMYKIGKSIERANYLHTVFLLSEHQRDDQEECLFEVLNRESHGDTSRKFCFFFPSCVRCVKSARGKHFRRRWQYIQRTQKELG